MLQHDVGSNCGDLGSTGAKGRYLMFPHATDEVRENNDKFSPCSIEHISNILKLKKDDCFVGEKEKTRPHPPPCRLLSRAESKAKCLHCALVTVNNYNLL